MDETVNETELVKRLSATVAKEQYILTGLHLLEFDESTIGLKRFDPAQIEAFRSIVAHHEKLMEKLSSGHLKPSLEDIRDVTKHMLQDFVYDAGDQTHPLKPEDCVMKTLLTVHKAGHATIERLSETGKEQHEDYLLASHTKKPDFPALHIMRTVHLCLAEVTIKAVEKMFGEEPHISAQQLWECAGEIIAVKQDLMKLESTRWWRTPSPGIVR